jgi:hypothetical protein
MPTEQLAPFHPVHHNKVVERCGLNFAFNARSNAGESATDVALALRSELMFNVRFSVL